MGLSNNDAPKHAGAWSHGERNTHHQDSRDLRFGFTPGAETDATCTSSPTLLGTGGQRCRAPPSSHGVSARVDTDKAQRHGSSNTTALTPEASDYTAEAHRRRVGATA